MGNSDKLIEEIKRLAAGAIVFGFITALFYLMTYPVKLWAAWSLRNEDTLHLPAYLKKLRLRIMIWGGLTFIGFFCCEMVVAYRINPDEMRDVYHHMPWIFYFSVVLVAGLVGGIARRAVMPTEEMVRAAQKKAREKAVKITTALNASSYEAKNFN